MFPYFPQAVARDVRVAVVEDAMTCARIHATSFMRGWSVQEFEALLADAQILGHLSVQIGGGPPEGFVLSRMAVDQAEILSIAVLPDARGKRLGSSLLRRHMAMLDTLGVKKLFLEVNADNLSALALYRACRFTQVGTRKSYYASPDGTARDALVLCCEDLRQ